MRDQDSITVVRAPGITALFAFPENLKSDGTHFAAVIVALLVAGEPRSTKPQPAQRKAKRVGSTGSRHG